MGTLEDVRNWLKEIPLWRELGTIPDRTAALEKKVEELENKLDGKSARCLPIVWRACC